MNNNTVTAAAVAKMNEVRHASVVDKAMVLISKIKSLQASNQCFEVSIKLTQGQLIKLSHDVIDYPAIVGVEAPLAPNVNQVTILKGLEEANKARQSGVDQSAKAYSDDIIGMKASIKLNDEIVAELRKELAKLGAEELTVGEVVS